MSLIRDNKELHISQHEILKSSFKMKMFLDFFMVFHFVSNH